MQITAEEFLPIAEKAGELVFVDIEASNLKGDYGSALVVSMKPYKKDIITLAAKTAGDDRQLVREARDLLEGYKLWASFYGKMFDIPFLNTRLVHHGLRPLDRRHHIDLYWIVRGTMQTSRRSQAHLLEFLDSPMKKLTLSPDVWNLVLRNPQKGFAILKKRCESDVEGLEALYDRVKPLIREIQR